MIDIHCHILPGLDDGARDLETTIEMARLAEKDGIDTIIATPHTDLDEGYPPQDLIRELTQEANDAIGRNDIGVSILPGAEINVTENLAEHLEAGNVVTMADRGRHVLIELPFTTQAVYVGDLFFDVQIKGYTPIIAHPERSALARIDLDGIRGLAKRGAQLQVNASSVLGGEGRRVQRIARTLIEEGLVDFLATDAHNVGKRAPRLSPARNAVRRLGGDGLFEALTQAHPAALMAARPAGEDDSGGG